jgi:L-asparaginase/Glu-tRNA(Gln) amidotransferase subunit D
MGPLLIRHLGHLEVDGLIVESLASGQVPPALEAPLAHLQQSGVQVVPSTRCQSGRLRVREKFPLRSPATSNGCGVVLEK